MECLLLTARKAPRTDGAALFAELFLGGARCHLLDSIVSETPRKVKGEPIGARPPPPPKRLRPPTRRCTRRAVRCRPAWRSGPDRFGTWTPAARRGGAYPRAVPHARAAPSPGAS